MPLAQDRGDERHGEALGARHAQASTGAVADRARRLHGGRGGLERATGVREGGTAGGRQAYPAWTAVEQCRSCLAFQLGQLVRDRGLGQVQQPGGFGDRSAVGDRDQTFQRAERSHPQVYVKPQIMNLVMGRSDGSLVAEHLGRPHRALSGSTTQEVDMAQVFVTGGSGFIGQVLIRRLVDEGHDVRALVRSAASADTVAALGAEPVRGS